MKWAKKLKTARYSLVLCSATALVGAGQSLAQVPVDENGVPLAPIDADPVYSDIDATLYDEVDDGEVTQLTAAELEALIGPVALYPDDLLAIVLPASTYPLEIVQAARFLDQLETDANLEPNEDWDESVTALLNYPEIVRLMNDDIDWTWKLGEAVVRQQQDVIAAVESFRDRAYAAGNLKSDDRQTVNNEDGVIEIVPIDDEIIYVPYYEPERVLVTQVRPVYHYYPRAYPVYYYPYPYGHSFASGYFWGVTTAYRIGWASHNLHVHHHSFWGHPYYGRRYFGHYYRRPTINLFNNWYVDNSRRRVSNRYRDGDYWRPRRHGGIRPGDYRSRTRSYRARNVSTNLSSNHRARNQSNVGNRTANNRAAPTQRNAGESRRTENGGNIVFRERRQTRTATVNRNDGQSRERNRTQTRNTVARRSTPTTVRRNTSATNTSRAAVARRQTLAAETRQRGDFAQRSTRRATSPQQNRTQANRTQRSAPQASRTNRQTSSGTASRRASPTPAAASPPAVRRSDSSSSRSRRNERSADKSTSNRRASSANQRERRKQRQ